MQACLCAADKKAQAPLLPLDGDACYTEISLKRALEPLHVFSVH